MTSWYPHATRDPGQDGGGFVAGYARKGVLHTTEGTTAAGAMAAYRAARSWPHFTVTYERGHVEVYQHVPVTRAARALRNPRGGVQTNRGGAIQLELVGTCDPARRGAGRWLHVEDFPAGYLAGIASLMRWLEQTCGIQPRTVGRWLPYPQSYGLDNDIRFSAVDWRAFRGWCGHMHTPENTHGDPGRLDLPALLTHLQEDPMPDAQFFAEQTRYLADVVKGQTGEQARIMREQHGDLMPVLGATLAKLDALPEAIAAAVAAKFDGCTLEEELPPADQPPAADGA